MAYYHIQHALSGRYLAADRTPANEVPVLAANPEIWSVRFTDGTWPVGEMILATYAKPSLARTYVQGNAALLLFLVNGSDLGQRWQSAAYEHTEDLQLHPLNSGRSLV